jgi:hypothetical protein
MNAGDFVEAGPFLRWTRHYRRDRAPSRSSSRIRKAGGLILAGLAATTSVQAARPVDNDKSPWHPTRIEAVLKSGNYPVVSADANSAQIELNGKIVPLNHDATFVPARANSFGPGSIEITDQKPSLDTAANPTAGVEVDLRPKHGVRYNATIASSLDFDDCYVVLVFHYINFQDPTRNALRIRFFFQRIGKLVAGKETSFEMQISRKALRDFSPGVRFFPLFFSHGREIRSNQSGVSGAFFHDMECERHFFIVDSYLAKNPTTTVAAAQPYLTVWPLLPAGITRAQAPEQVELWVDARGLVTAVDIDFMLPPALTTELVRAYGGWLLLPRLENGHPEKSRVMVPVKFPSETARSERH